MQKNSGYEKSVQDILESLEHAVDNAYEGIQKALFGLTLIKDPQILDKKIIVAQDKLVRARKDYEFVNSKSTPNYTNLPYTTDQLRNMKTNLEYLNILKREGTRAINDYMKVYREKKGKIEGLLAMIDEMYPNAQKNYDLEYLQSTVNKKIQDLKNFEEIALKNKRIETLAKEN